MSESELIAPSMGDKFVKREEPDKGRVVTVSRVWTDDDGCTAVAYDWTDNKPGWCGSACPLDVFQRTYRVVSDGLSAREKLIRSVYSRLSQNQMEELVDAYAHELAEKIRSAGCQEINWCGCPIAANLIDPEVTR
ncbi:hypothetical protein [Streptomyces misionensis]|uniref:hypothetical protein n=1 Tax=Streptomyces misionensis TaxID=67331 RepID=UPI00369C1308